MSEPKLRPLEFGEILDGAFTLYRHHFSTFFATALIAVIPMTLLSGMMENAALAADAEASVGMDVILLMLFVLPTTALLWTVVWGALTRQTAEAYGGQLTSLRDGYTHALRALPRLIGAGLLLLAALFALTIAFGILSAVAMMFLAPRVDGVMAQLIPFIFMLVIFLGMFVLMANLFAVMPSIVIEGLGPWTALKRSQQLASGARLRIIGVLIVGSLIVILPTVGILMAVGLGASLVDPGAAATMSPMQVVMEQLISMLSGALTVPFMVGCMTLLYFDRRVRTEAYDLEVAADNLSVSV